MASEEASFSFTVTGPGTYYANFAIDTYEITASANPAEGGTVEGDGIYDYGATATLTATANEGYTFVNWTRTDGSVASEEASFSFEVTESGDFVANFSLNSYDITVSANPADGGTVDGGGTFNHGETATLTAEANESFFFINWIKDGNIVSNDATYTFTVTEGGDYVANFSHNIYVITATANPLNGGVVDGAGNYGHGDMATLTATANEGYTFINWTTADGSVASEEASFSFEVTASGDFIANFNLNTYEIVATTDPIDCGTITGTGTYNYGEIANVTVVPNPNYVFDRWTLNGVLASLEPSLSFVVTESYEFVAHLIYYDGVEETSVSATIYPNPVDDKVWVESMVPIQTCEVYNTMGSLVYSAAVHAGQFEVDMESLPSGTYMIRLVADGFVNVHTIIKR